LTILKKDFSLNATWILKFKWILLIQRLKLLGKVHFSSNIFL
jgi:hypothetical protein